MTAEAFAHGPAVEGVLTDGEKVQVFRLFTAAIPQTLFPDTPRYAAESYACERLAYLYGLWNISGTTQAIDFSVSRAVSVTGFGACVFYNGSQTGSRYTIVTKLALGSAVLATKELRGTITQYSQTPVSVNFDKPPKLDATKRYTVSLVVTGPQTYFGSHGSSSKTVTTKKGHQTVQ